MGNKDLDGCSQAASRLGILTILKTPVCHSVLFVLDIVYTMLSCLWSNSVPTCGSR